MGGVDDAGGAGDADGAGVGGGAGFSARGKSTSTFVPSLNVSVASSGEPFSRRDTTTRAVRVVPPFVHVAVDRAAAERPKRLIFPPENAAVHTEPSGSVAEKLPAPALVAVPWPWTVKVGSA